MSCALAPQTPPQPMISLNLTTSLLGAALATAILVLVRRDHLHLSHGVSWIIVAATAALLGAWPMLLDRIAFVAGIAYPPALLLLAGVVVLLIKALLADIANTRLERQVRRLNQRLAMFEAEYEQRARAGAKVAGAGSDFGTSS
ncbi:putative protein DUF2304 [Aromatoleum bremense]|nr:putative protein DUF2304 [Aromatoleum bremense]